jgi:acetyl esterase/lipase
MVKKLNPRFALVALVVLALSSFMIQNVSALPSGPTFKEVLVATPKELDGKDFPLRTNIFLPATPQAAPTPLVLFIHGHGGAYNFSAGSRSYEFSIALKDRGIAVATIDYRNNANVLMDLYDVKAYIRYFRAHAKEYNIDPYRIAVWGTSRGGQLAALVLSTGDMKDLEGDVGGNLDQSSALQCGIIFYAITDMYSQYDGKNFPFIGADPADYPAIAEAYKTNDTASPMWKYVELAKKVDPISYVDAKDPPVLIAVSALDPVTPAKGSLALFQKYVEKGVEADLYMWSKGTHGAVGPDIEAASSEWIVKKLLVDLL